jgi:hypothetical protein
MDTEPTAIGEPTQAFDPVAEDAPRPSTDNGAAKPSVLDNLRAMREAKAQDAEPALVLDVPGWQDGTGATLAVIYRYPAEGYKRVVSAIEREQSTKDANARLHGASDLLTACCGSVVGRDAAGALIDLHTSLPLGAWDGSELPDPPVRFERWLAEALGIEVAEDIRGVGRFVLREVFSPRATATGVYDGDVALISHSNRVFMWLNKAELAIDEDFQGE